MQLYRPNRYLTGMVNNFKTFQGWRNGNLPWLTRYHFELSSTMPDLEDKKHRNINLNWNSDWVSVLSLSTNFIYFHTNLLLIIVLWLLWPLLNYIHSSSKSWFPSLCHASHGHKSTDVLSISAYFSSCNWNYLALKYYNINKRQLK